jgi:hypothetical protein
MAEDIIVLLDLVNQFNTWLSIHLNVKKCKITEHIHDL